MKYGTFLYFYRRARGLGRTRLQAVRYALQRREELRRTSRECDPLSPF